MKTILVVDDEIDIAEALQAVLETEGYHVDTCGDGAACLERLRQGHADLVLLDIMMPRIDGFGVLDRLRERGVDTPVLLMSAVRPTERLAEYRDQFAAFMKKPFELDKLLDTVADILS